jgi:hypothetical protein
MPPPSVRVAPPALQKRRNCRLMTPPVELTMLPAKELIPCNLRKYRLLQVSDLYRGFESRPLRHAVCDAEKTGLHSPENRRKSPQFRNFGPQTGPEKMSRRTPQPSFTAFFSGGHTRSPVSTSPRGEWNTITNRWFGERLLDFLAERRFADVVTISSLCRLFPIPTAPYGEAISLCGVRACWLTTSSCAVLTSLNRDW